MEPSKVAWGIEVGEFALKAIRLALVDNEIHVTDFAVIPHQKVLSDPSVSDREGMIRVTLGAFVQAHAEHIASEPIIMSLPGNVGFARFATIPAVDAKTLRSMIEYEAKQQIPFPIEEVEWDSHVLPADESGQCAIGIFAVTKERLHELLTLYAECGLEPDVLTLSSVAVYNALHYDLELEDKPQAISCIDIGTNSSDLVVIAGGKFWIRTFPVGGSQFTSAIADAFASQNVNYTRAEKIKLDRAPSEKVLRARTMAMRRVTGQLVDEIGRSREFYQSANEGVDLKRAYGVGSTLKISGLRTKIASDLQMTVDRLEEFKRIQLSGPDAADFAAHSINLLTALGLAIQGLGLAKVELNLSPLSRVRRKIWKSKTPWFIASAAVLLLCSVAMFTRGTLDYFEFLNLKEAGVNADKVVSNGKTLVGELTAVQEINKKNGDDNVLALLENRGVWPYLIQDTYSALSQGGGVLSDKKRSPQAAEIGNDPVEILKIPLDERNLIELKDFSGQKSFNSEKNEQRIAMSVSFSFTNKDSFAFLKRDEGVLAWLKDPKNRPDAPYTIDEASVLITNMAEVQGGVRKEETPTGQPNGSESGVTMASGDQSAPDPNSGGGGSVLKKKTRDQALEDDPTTRNKLGLGAGGDPSGGADGNTDDGSGGSPTSGGRAGPRRAKTITVASDEKLPAIDLAKDAPIPAAPTLIKERGKDVRYEGILRFTVVLKFPKPSLVAAEGSQ